LPIPSLTYIFPISPAAVKKEFSSLNTVYDVQGSPQNQGVQRLVDMWGQAPPIITLRGTTGWKRHSLDFFALSGKDSLTMIQNLLSTFAQKNQELMAKNATDYYSLELYNYWDSEFWSVVPIGPQGIEQSADRPIIGTYIFRLACIRAVAAPIPPLAMDLIVSLWSAGAQQIQIINSSLSMKLSSY
jgi:hypothetical protein